MTPLLAQRLRTDRSFERLYRRYVSDVYHYALAVCRNPADAEDVTQTTFLNAYRAVQAGQEPRAPKNWLLAIAHNVMRQRFRASSRRPSEVEMVDEVAAAVPDDDGYTAEEIRRALGHLNFNQRAALVMRELEGRSYAEIAEILGISIGAVETLIFRARRALREQLEESLTCNEAELAISRQLDGRLSRADKGALRAHLRTCEDCARFARSQRAHRAALKGLAAAPLPASLTSLFGGGAAVGTALATKAAAVTALGLLVAGGTIETTRHVHHHPTRASAQEHATSPVAPIAPALHSLVEAARALPHASTVTATDVKRGPVKSHALIQAPGRRRRVRGGLPTTSTVTAIAGALPSPNAQALPGANGNQGRRAHGAPATTHPSPSRPSTPAHGRPVAHKNTPVAKGRADAVAPTIIITTPSPHTAKSNGQGRGVGHGKANAAPPADTTTTTTVAPTVEP